MRCSVQQHFGLVPCVLVVIPVLEPYLEITRCVLKGQTDISTVEKHVRAEDELTCVVQVAAYLDGETERRRQLSVSLNRRCP